MVAGEKTGTCMLFFPNPASLQPTWVTCIMVVWWSVRRLEILHRLFLVWCNEMVLGGDAASVQALPV